ncbi:hypothetical protein HanHA300_Chr03g0074581 [Helianthus annuus]|nr:hypothetical protein HanHA300_Chr03g0074581 [Helianthus annuus]KAJ0606446.1 hypothetical protein HanHA89_Chr03g0085191 [Helianthus annuus]KAJ0772438.1 hypothetical protein HanOQP8_Chr03g0087311 [Helianthus annuus]
MHSLLAYFGIPESWWFLRKHFYNANFCFLNGPTLLDKGFKLTEIALFCFL